MRYFLIFYVFVVVAAVSFLGLPGTTFKNPPIWVFPDMDNQARYNPQGANDFFADGRNDRPEVPGTVARGTGLVKKEVFSETYVYQPSAKPLVYTGKKADGQFVKGFPLEVNNQLMELGKKKFTIYCAVCHGDTGDGKGITRDDGSEFLAGRGYLTATANLLDKRIVDMPEGQIFNTITNGFGQMLSYGDKMSPEERWAVILYVRALERSQHATIKDVPDQEKIKLGL